MDKIIEKKTGWRAAFTRKAVKYWLAGAFAVLMTILLLNTGGSSLRIDGSSIISGDVTEGEFNDYIRISGQLQPMVTIQLSPLEGGTVEKIFVEEGAKVSKGEPIVILCNDNLDLQILNSEAELAEKENILRNTLISLEQQKLSHEKDRLSYETQAWRNKRAYEQNSRLYEEKLISREEYLKAKEDYELARKNLDLTLRSMIQDSLYRSTEITRLRESLDNMRMNMQLIRGRKDKLTIKAPIDGVIGLLDANLGQYIASGVRIGQINSEGNYKIEAKIDEHYIDKVVPGLQATFNRQNEKFDAQVRKVYPEVRDGKFQADFKFVGGQPENIRTGQTYYLNLQLGQAEQSVLIPRGTFYQNTGGKWVYVLSKDGGRAVKRSIRIGRQNPQFYEILEGLEPGEKVIVSNYDSYGDKDELIIR